MIYNLIRGFSMKFVILLFSALFFSGCASSGPYFSKINFEKNGGSIKGGSINFYGNLDHKNLENIPRKISDEMHDLCLNRNFLVTSWERENEDALLLFFISTSYKNNVNFECLNEKNKP